MMRWRSLDQATTRVLILAAYRRNKLGGAQAWQQFTQNDLWEDKEEEFYHYQNGLDAAEARKGLWEASTEFKDAARALIRTAFEQKTITPASEEWLRDLFGLSRETDG
jgi:hypothetical protein